MNYGAARELRHTTRALVWSAPLSPGKYDIAVDAFFDFRYDVGSSGVALDDMDVSTAGFFVIPEFPRGLLRRERYWINRSMSSLVL